MSRIIYFLFSLTIIFSCDKIESEDSNTKKIFFNNGTLKSITRVDDNKKMHGISKQYYPSGEIKVEIEYDHGKKINSKQYYENGNLQMTFSYLDGLKQGKRTKYWKNGSISSELEYNKNNPGIGLTEYNKNGTKITKYPQLIIKKIDRLESRGEFLIQVYFSSNSNRGTYYMGKLEDGFLPPNLEKIKKSNGKGVITIKPVPGTFMMEKVTFIGSFKTAYGNPYIVEKTINVAIDF